MIRLTAPRANTVPLTARPIPPPAPGRPGRVPRAAGAVPAGLGVLPRLSLTYIGQLVQMPVMSLAEAAWPACEEVPARSSRVRSRL